MLKVEGLEDSLFSPESVDSETKAYVTQLEATLADIPLPYTQEVQTLRDAAASGQSLFGPIEYSEIATPLYADLTGLPPALFTIGTEDPLLDDTLFTYSRWLAAGNEAQIAVYPGAPHAFPLMPIGIGKQANQRSHAFIKRSLGIN